MITEGTVDLDALRTALPAVQGSLPWRATDDETTPIRDTFGGAIIEVDPGVDEDDYTTVDMRPADRDYLVAAVNAVPHLLQEIDRLNGRIPDR